MTKVRWGVLSTAVIAQEQQIPALQRAENAEVTAIATSSHIEKAQVIAEKFNIEKTYDSYEKLLNDPDIDAVYIPLPNHLHKKWVIAAAKKGKHILCEKPAAINATEFIEMQKVCSEHDVLFMEAFMYFFHPQHERVRQIIDSGEIGEITYAQAGFSFYIEEEDKAENIRLSDKKGGGSIYDVGCYAIHALRNVLDSEPKSVHVHTLTDETYHVDTDVVGYLTFENGVRATFDASFNLAMRHEYRLFGTEGSIVVPRAYRPDIYGGEAQIIVEKGNKTRTEIVNGDQYKNQVEHISQAILAGEQQTIHDPNNTLHNMHVIDACYESIKTGRKVKLA